MNREFPQLKDKTSRHCFYFLNGKIKLHENLAQPLAIKSNFPELLSFRMCICNKVLNVLSGDYRHGFVRATYRVISLKSELENLRSRRKI